jgi:hypothetical protein
MGTVRDGAALTAAGLAPFAAGAALPAGGDGIGPACPFRALTGLPCPFCGATRAFVLAMRGDGSFVHYNAAWVLLAALAVLLGAAVMVTRRGPPPLLRTPRRALLVLALLAAGPWAYALTQRDAIVAQNSVRSSVSLVLVWTSALPAITTSKISKTQIAMPIQPRTMPAIAIPRPPI